MPLGFESTSHGSIAFGFFNIESDMLLLDSLFFFADAFCSAVEQAGEHGRAEIDGYRIDEREKIGDLHGAIAGRVFSGFIGSTYRVWPFQPYVLGTITGPLVSVAVVPFLLCHLVGLFPRKHSLFTHKKKR